jgi:GNAT superfamily N-acetyltransferase
VDARLRIAAPADAPAIEALMKESGAALFPAVYDERQAESMVRHVADVDELLLTDGTYFVIEAEGELVACGGWSKRDKRYTGGDGAGDERLLDPATEPARVRAMFVRSNWTRRGLGRRILEECEAAAKRAGFHSLVLSATLSGVPLYEAYGFTAVEDEEMTMPDGVTVKCLAMEKPIP